MIERPDNTYFVEIPHMGIKCYIPEVLLYNYANTFIPNMDLGSYHKTRKHLDAKKMIKTRTITTKNDKFDAHDKIFKYLGLSHVHYDAKESLEYWLQEAIEEWWQRLETFGEVIESCIVHAIEKKGLNNIPYYISKVTTIPPSKVANPRPIKHVDDETHTRKLAEN